jgi:hypothetical protein
MEGDIFMTPIRVLFGDHGAFGSNSAVAGISVEWLIDHGKPEFEIHRVTRITEQFDRAVLHLDENEFESLPHTLIALRLTTRPGIPPDIAHRFEENGRVLLAVRRMAALTNPAAWKAFLAASVVDCKAIAQGRPEDVADDRKPMLSLFQSRDEVLVALRILCVAFLEIERRKISGDEFWAKRASEAARPAWWQRVLDGALMRADDGFKPWGAIRKIDRKKAVSLLLERLTLEPQALEPSPNSVVRRLTEIISDEAGLVKAPIVEVASQRLAELMK